MPTLLNIKIQSACFGIPLERAGCKGGHALEIAGVDTGCTPYHEVSNHPGGDPHLGPNLIRLWLPDSLGASTGSTDKRWRQGMIHPEGG